ncbi:2-succinyl-5-enolpyruvyl-6-hydroxy-3-cyclohexene-1-carboxylic-acid synthase [Salinirubellus salinus]|uniref:2-succinyl-5-enolpyruvyl-6-hydroxy-3-cyclohexene-1-carboxylate synthase n=1 Tax=Salinirubellus salinus TaxID=1364945 RepID=A0A9E7U5J5_9EURY|nr:2-succinyl-5-enolpyruvyl-6-hydroxy-3-cyclohexene-1-carboxylic-acid synthase [Salinirubellus salinus]UWM55455.1 2-succinyl-5-enolpyruvyl-6-hydroxy-3-cyclohexene-1-carboxylic-acid synthase [Salinirubellus salinus]
MSGERRPPVADSADWPDAVADSPNESTLWGRVVVDELYRAGVDAACLAPGSRSTPLTMAFADHPGVRVFSHLDERSAAFFALGRAKRTGRPTPVVTTSGTATANLHPAVIEANQARVPMLLLTADRPRELQHSGANQTVDQEKLYGDAVRHYRSLPDPAFDGRKLRAVRTAVSRAVHTASDGANPGPVHLNCPFRKPLEPTPTDPPEGWAEASPLGARGRPDGTPFVAVTEGRTELASADRARLVEAVEGADAGVLVCGPADAPTPSRDAMRGLALSTGFPVLADPLSGLRWGQHVDADGVTVCGGYDAYLGALETYPDVVLRFGASPTSKPLRRYLAEAGRRGARQFVVDPAGGWREAAFTATDLVVAAPTPLAAALSGRVEREAGGFEVRLADLETAYWDRVADESRFLEGDVLGDVAALAPDPSTVFVSNSMPVRDLDRFGRPHDADLTVLGNRGASGIDGIASTGLGAGSASEGPLVLVTGDLAYYHDSNGLLAVARSGVDATVVLVNNDGGGIFHLLPVESFDPPFTEQFTTPHGLDFEPTADLYGLEFARTDDRETFRDLFAESVATDGTQVIEVVFDGEASHRGRETLQQSVHEWVRSRDGRDAGHND